MRIPSNTVNTVTGPVAIENLGQTLMHEHLLIGLPGWQMDTLAPAQSRQNLIDICVGKIRKLQNLGVNTLLDPCPSDLGRDVNLAVEVSRQTGFNIICATGLYTEALGGQAYWKILQQVSPDKLVERWADIFAHELTVGIDDTDIRAGVIKVGSSAGQITDYEYLVMRAAALAHKRTGAPVTTHTDGDMGKLQQDFLIECGVSAHQIIIGHCCGNPDPDYHLSIAEQGSYVGFDRFGAGVLMPDETRIDNLIRFIEAGFVKRAIISHDCCFCMRGAPFPAELTSAPSGEFFVEPTYIHEVVLPALRKRGVSQAMIDELLIHNPRRYFQGATSS